MKLFSLTVIVAILVLDILAIIFKSKAKNVYPLKWIKAFCTCLAFAGSLSLVSQYVWYGAVKGRVIEAFLWSSIALAVFSVYSTKTDMYQFCFRFYQFCFSRTTEYLFKIQILAFIRKINHFIRRIFLHTFHNGC